MNATIERRIAAPEELTAALRWRYATKHFDASRRIPAETWRALEEALVLSPSSYGLQPWRFFLVENPELRAKLKAVSWNQPQITDADKLVVFAVRSDFGLADVERFIARMAEQRGVSLASLESYKKVMLAKLDLPPAERDAWLARQVYIALGTFLTSAAVLGVDACPMEGFDKTKYDELLGLAAKGYTTLCVATAGYRSTEDAYAGQTKVRFAASEVIVRL